MQTDRYKFGFTHEGGSVLSSCWLVDVNPYPCNALLYSMFFSYATSMRYIGSFLTTQLLRLQTGLLMLRGNFEAYAEPYKFVIVTSSREWSTLKITSGLGKIQHLWGEYKSHGTYLKSGAYTFRSSLVCFGLENTQSIHLICKLMRVNFASWPWLSVNPISPGIFTSVGYLEHNQRSDPGVHLEVRLSLPTGSQRTQLLETREYQTLVEITGEFASSLP